MSSLTSAPSHRRRRSRASTTTLTRDA
jgi:hypothetical protein